jgi:hypothetical protein
VHVSIEARGRRAYISGAAEGRRRSTGRQRLGDNGAPQHGSQKRVCAVAAGLFVRNLGSRRRRSVGAGA